MSTYTGMLCMKGCQKGLVFNYRVVKKTTDTRWKPSTWEKGILTRYNETIEVLDNGSDELRLLLSMPLVTVRVDGDENMADPDYVVDKTYYPERVKFPLNCWTLCMATGIFEDGVRRVNYDTSKNAHYIF